MAKDGGKNHGNLSFVYVALGKNPLSRINKDTMRDLAPEIYRQRLVIEAFPKAHLTEFQIKKYLSELSVVLKMKTLIQPVTHKSDQFGWAAWIHWETSGAHFYAWDQPRLFFSVDIYTCKRFSPKKALAFTEKFFETTEMVFKEF